MILSRRRVAAYIADGLATDRSHRLKQAAAWLESRHRAGDINLLTRDVADILSTRGYLVAHVTSAHKLSLSEVTAIKTSLMHQTNCREIELETWVDPTVIGGLKIALPDRELDTTVAATLHSLVTEMTR